MKFNLEARVYRPKGEVYAALVVVHGMEEHSLRYHDFAQYLVDHGIFVFTYDLPGHGGAARSGDELGWFGEKAGWELLLDSVKQAVETVRNEVGNIPVWLFGHSMGSMLARCYIQENDTLIDGLILSGPPCYNPLAPAALAMTAALGKVKGSKGHSHLLDQAITGAFNSAIEHPRTQFDWLSHNEDNVDAYIADPLCGNPFTISGYQALLSGMVMMQSVKSYQCASPSLPIFVFAGEEDPCIGGPEGFNDSVQVLQKAGYNNVKTHLFEGMRHEILNETGRQEVCEIILDAIVRQGK